MKYSWNKIIARRVPLGIILAGIVLAFIVVHFIPTTTSQYSEAQIFRRTVLPMMQYSSVGTPIRLRIPAIQVDAPISAVGLTPDGSMGVPQGPDDLVWFGLGPRPGEKGSAVIAGHYGWKNGIPAVFDDLRMLHKGDRLYVEDQSGKTTIFVVREIRVYKENDDASAVFNLGDNRAHLNLVTCSGTWNATQKSYSNRIVVFTDMVMQ